MLLKLELEYQVRYSLRKGGNELAECNLALLKRGAANMHYIWNKCLFILFQKTVCIVKQCLSTAGPRPGTGPWQQLDRAARGSPGICHFSFLSNFHE
jgi:hypothetical protein